MQLDYACEWILMTKLDLLEIDCIYKRMLYTFVLQVVKNLFFVIFL
jgi:hypothetical protein